MKAPMVGTLVAALVATACASDSLGGQSMTVRAEGVSRLAPSPDAPVRELARSIGALGYELGTVSVEPNQNWVVSPASIAMAFAMARAGAAGETAAQIDRVFGFPPNGLHEAFNSVGQQVVTADVPPKAKAEPTREAGVAQPPPVVCVGNALFPQNGLPVGKRFLRTLAEQYGAGVDPVDFGSPTAKKTIDEWVRRQTADRIKELFAELPADTRLVLANTVYLKADWIHYFLSVTEEIFHRADGTDVQVPTMRQQAPLRYAAGPGWQAAELPMAGGELAMRILVPTGSTPPRDLLAPETMAAVAGRLTQQQVDVSIPRWDFATELDLDGLLRQLGLTVPFSLGADFSGIAPGLYIDQAIHKANITVDEWGTEAAAVTGLVFPVSAGPTATARVRADRPFAFAVVHAPTGVPLFVGQVADPSATS